MCKIWNMTLGIKFEGEFQTVEEFWDYLDERYEGNAQKLTSHYDSLNEKWYYLFRANEKETTPEIYEIYW